ncbi:MAG: hypothetical protein A4E73_00950 [Syntrophaceae bacterium PtaU1.Bin231]|nr:MAG: hypothetical protein A4E73_00950 [Syntrophaceae bacterium PtaU1.Bin231]
MSLGVSPCLRAWKAFWAAARQSEGDFGSSFPDAAAGNSAQTVAVTVASHPQGALILAGLRSRRIPFSV